MELNAYVRQMHTAAARRNSIVVNINSSAASGNSIAVDVLLMVSDIVVVYLHIRALAGYTYTNVAAFRENIIMDMYVPAADVQTQ